MYIHKTTGELVRVISMSADKDDMITIEIYGTAKQISYADFVRDYALVKFGKGEQEMNWYKYTLDEWLTQFGAWCDTCHDRGGRLPDGLHVNNLYYLMRRIEPRPSRYRPQCHITDAEAYAVNDLLAKAMRIIPKHISLLIAHKVHGRSLREIAMCHQSTTTSVHDKINCASYYLAGFLRIDP